ncbi:MAG: DUF4097 family beta strand repeat-containing protein [Longimicrobiales bacterium]
MRPNASFSHVSAGVLLLGVTALADGPASAQQRYELTGTESVIYNIAGRVSIERGGGENVEVLVTPGGADAARLRIASGPIDGRSTLRVIYPDDRIAYSPDGWSGNTTLRVRSDGTFGDGGERVRVGRSGGLEAHADLRIRVPAGRRVAVLLGVGDVRATNVEGDLLIDVAAAPVVVDGFRGALLIDTGSGSVDVSDAAGEIAIDTGSGSVDVLNLVGPRLRIDTGSGGVDGSDIRVGRLEVDTGSGGIELLQVSTPWLELDTGSGGVEIDLLSDVEHAVIDTGSGSVRVRVPADIGAELIVDTGAGGIDVDVPVDVTERDRNELRGTLGDGNGRIEIDTGSGSVRLEAGG